MVNMLAAALKYARRGTPIFPLDPADKSPLCPRGFYAATANENQVRRWWQRWPNAMIGMPTGPRTRIWVLDIDVDLLAPTQSAHPMARLLAIHGPLPDTAMSITPRGGWHFFFRWDGADIRCSIGKLGPGVDVRGHGGYVAIPPSVRADGTPYRWCSVNGVNAKATEAPSWLVEEILKIQSRNQTWVMSPVPILNGAFQKSGEPSDVRDHIWARCALEQECALVVAAPVGTRNDALNRAAFNLFQIVAGGALGEQEVGDRLFAAAEACGLVADDGAQQVVATIESGAYAGSKHPRHRPR
jgi:putative DNA primase/helicase